MSRYAENRAEQSSRFPRAILIASVVLAVVYLPLLAFALPRVAAIAKVGSILCLLALAERPGVPRSLLAALGLSALGDLLLAFQGLTRLEPLALFISGLGIFLIAHLCYITLFVGNREQHRISGQRGSEPKFLRGFVPGFVLRRLGMVAIVAALLALLKVLWPTLGFLRIPVLVYSVALGLMAITAQRSRYSYLVPLGALLFVASDAMLAYARFRRMFVAAPILVWTSYYLAQCFITIGVSKADQASQ